jgi:hypothetical protein
MDGCSSDFASFWLRPKAALCSSVSKKGNFIVASYKKPRERIHLIRRLHEEGSNNHQY